MITWFNLVKKSYCYVPPCPKCGSPMTGRYIIVWFRRDWMIEDALRHGEHVRLTYDRKLKDVAFCVKCNYEWAEFMPEIRITRTEMNYQKKIRETNIFLDLFRAEKKYKKLKRWFSLF